jgi:Sensors of blue-light using FAD
VLVRLLYASRAAQKTDGDLVDKIMEESRAYNQEHGITGVLCVCEASSVFMQVLEGGREEVNRLYNRIVPDPRHKDILLLDYAEITERRFAGWRMGRIDLNKVNRTIVLRYSEKPQLDPYLLHGRQALALFEEIVSTMPA